MPEYVYALHDFVPENPDEVPFKAGDKIEVIEKDDLYQDGWWQVSYYVFFSSGCFVVWRGQLDYSKTSLPRRTHTPRLERQKGPQRITPYRQCSWSYAPIAQGRRFTASSTTRTIAKRASHSRTQFYYV